MEFVAIDFETTGYEAGSKNEPWQLGAAVVRDFEIVETYVFQLVVLHRRKHLFYSLFLLTERY